MRFVLDTNVLVSALLFKGESQRLYHLRSAGRFLLLASSGVLLEYPRVLAYPKFGLDETTVVGVLRTHIVPFLDSVRVDEGARLCRDPDDDKFIWCARDGHADGLATGDRDLLSMRDSVVPLAVLTVKEAVASVESDP